MSSAPSSNSSNDRPIVNADVPSYTQSSGLQRSVATPSVDPISRPPNEQTAEGVIGEVQPFDLHAYLDTLSNEDYAAFVAETDLAGKTTLPLNRLPTR